MVGVDLTDGMAGLRAHVNKANLGQIETAIEAHRLATSENLAAEPLLEALAWE